MVSGAALYPSRQAVYHDSDLARSHPMLPRIHAMMLAGRPRPVTPYYLVLSTTVQPEFSAVLVGLKSPQRAIRDGRRRLEHFLVSLR
jgi:multiple sugar transport system substrate-binding protein